jgi:hypothetical protein
MPLHISAYGTIVVMFKGKFGKKGLFGKAGLRVGLIALIIALVGAWYIPSLFAAPGDWWNNSWTARRKITFNNTASAENLINFPVRVSFTSSNIDYAKTQNSGQDIRFVDADSATVLSHDIETWNEAGTSEVWVKVPQINMGSTIDHIYVYFGNAGAANGEAKTSVWSNGYTGVWHMNDNAANTTVTNTTSTGSLNGVNAVNTSTKTVAGKVSSGLLYNGSSDQTTITDQAALRPGTGNYTAEFWYSNTASCSGVYCTFMDKREGFPGNSFVILRSISGNLQVQLNTGVQKTWEYSAAPSAYTKVTMVIDRSANVLRFYVNGVLQTSATSNDISTLATLSGTGSLLFGTSFASSDDLFGNLDEVRISGGIARSAEWIEAQYASENNTMNTIASEETVTTGTFTQAAYRWYVNANAVQPGTAYADASTSYWLPCESIQPLRLRMGVTTAGALSAGGSSFKLQYGSSTSGPWTDVGAPSTSGIEWSYYNNVGPADGDALTTLLLSGSTVLQTYEEGSPTALNPNAIGAGGRGEWDFALDSSNASLGTYYFRMVTSGGTAFTTYTAYPQVVVSNSPSPESTMRHGAYFDGGVKQKYGCTWTPGGAVSGTPLQTYATETFTGTNGAAWPAQWTTAVNTGGVVDIQTNTGRLVSSPGSYTLDNKAYLNGMTAVKNMDITLDVSFPDVTNEQYLFIFLRSDDTVAANVPPNGYELLIKPWNGVDTFAVRKKVSNVNTNISGDLNLGAFTASTAKRVRFQVIDDTLKVKVWDPAGAEPGTWFWSATDNSLSANTGKVLLQMNSGNAAASRTVNIDNITVTNGGI